MARPLPIVPALPNLPEKVEQENVKNDEVCRLRRNTETCYAASTPKDALMTDKTRRQTLEEMLADDPLDEFLRYGLGMEYVSGGDHETAVRVFQELIAQNPARPYIPAFLMAAQSLMKLGRSKAAIPILKQGVEEARKQNQQHPMGEMQTLLDSLE